MSVKKLNNSIEQLQRFIKASSGKNIPSDKDVTITRNLGKKQGTRTLRVNDGSVYISDKAKKQISLPLAKAKTLIKESPAEFKSLVKNLEANKAANAVKIRPAKQIRSALLANQALSNTEINILLDSELSKKSNKRIPGLFNKLCKNYKLDQSNIAKVLKFAAPLDSEYNSYSGVTLDLVGNQKLNKRNFDTLFNFTYLSENGKGTAVGILTYFRQNQHKLSPEQQKVFDQREAAFAERLRPALKALAKAWSKK